MKVKEALTKIDVHQENLLDCLNGLAKDYSDIDNYAEIARMRVLQSFMRFVEELRNERK